MKDEEQKSHEPMFEFILTVSHLQMNKIQFQTPGLDINIFVNRQWGVETPASVIIKDDLPPALS